jgi:uncharacterized protein YbjQ (UPF0145 family)
MERGGQMFVTTTFNIDGYTITEYKGLVRGIVVRSPTIAQGILGSLKNIIGGNIGAYTDMCEETRRQAYETMLDHARKMGANAIVGVRYDASEVVSRESATEVLCYGTAVVVTKVV